MTESWQLALQLSARLAAISSFEDYLYTAAGFLQPVLPGDSLRWTNLIPVTGAAGVTRLGNGEPHRESGSRYCLCMVVAPDAQAGDHGWIIGRNRQDFSDDEVELARHLLPVLTLGWAHLPRRAPVADPGSRPILSPRERHTLDLLATGCTAAAMARRMNVSPRTVRKHLGNLYQKMDVHDRLMAVERARSLGMLS